MRAYTEAALDFIFNYAPDKAQIFKPYPLSHAAERLCVHCEARASHKKIGPMAGAYTIIFNLE